MPQEQEILHSHIINTHTHTHTHKIHKVLLKHCIAFFLLLFLVCSKMFMVNLKSFIKCKKEREICKGIFIVKQIIA